LLSEVLWLDDTDFLAGLSLAKQVIEENRIGFYTLTENAEILTVKGDTYLDNNYEFVKSEKLKTGKLEKTETNIYLANADLCFLTINHNHLIIPKGYSFEISPDQKLVRQLKHKESPSPWTPVSNVLAILYAGHFSLIKE
jgi:hypothetical protein